MANELAVVNEDRAMQRHSSSVDMAQVLELARDPNFDAAKLHSLLDFRERLDQRNREAAFNSAMVACQSEMPRVTRDGVVTNKAGAVQSRYATIEHIEDLTADIRKKHGFAISYKAPEVEAKTMTIVAIVRHAGGHSEEHQAKIALDDFQYRTGPQNSTSTFTFGKRVLYCGIFNIVVEGKDKDGASEQITEEQELTLTTELRDRGASVLQVQALCGIFRASKILEIPACKFNEAMQRAKAVKGAK